MKCLQYDLEINSNYQKYRFTWQQYSSKVTRKMSDRCVLIFLQYLTSYSLIIIFPVTDKFQDMSSEF